MVHIAQTDAAGACGGNFPEHNRQEDHRSFPRSLDQHDGFPESQLLSGQPKQGVYERWNAEI
jgi:hypothetical protein